MITSSRGASCGGDQRQRPRTRQRDRSPPVRSRRRSTLFTSTALNAASPSTPTRLFTHTANSERITAIGRRHSCRRFSCPRIRVAHAASSRYTASAQMIATSQAMIRIAHQRVVREEHEVGDEAQPHERDPDEPAPRLPTDDRDTRKSDQVQAVCHLAVRRWRADHARRARSCRPLFQLHPPRAAPGMGRSARPSRVDRPDRACRVSR
jgi:hypothetical protein